MIIIYALVLCSIKAQEPIFNTVELSSSFRINSFAEDNNGFLWMATKEGLVFYNGFEDLKIDSASGAYYDLVLYGDFIISGKDNGKIEVFNTQTKRIEYNIQLPSKKRINNLFLSEEKIYVSTNGDGLFVVDNLFQNPNVYQYPGNYTKYLYKIVYSSNSDRFIISSDRGLYTLVKGDSIINKHKYFPDVIVNNLTLDESNLWCATYDSGLILLDLQTDSLSKYDQQTDEKIQDIVVHENTVYFCKESGLWTLGQDGNLSEINSLCLIENIGNLFLDSESNLWVGGKESTLCKGNLLFQIIPHNLSSDIQTIFEISDRIIIGSQQGLFFRKENGRWEKVINNNITHISGFNNYLLIGSYSNGLFILDNNLKVLKNITSKNGLINDAILDCHQVENGNYIVSTLAGLQSINLSTSNNEISLEADALFEKYQFHDYFLEVFKDEKAGMLLGTDKAGLVQIDNKVVRIDSLNDKKVGSIYSITRAKDRTLWLSSSNLGLLKFNKDSLQVIEEIQFDGDPYTSIIPLEKNHLLLVRKKSIDLYDVDNNNIIYFNKEINLSHREAYFNNYFVNEKNCYFVHNNEIYKFHLPDENVKVRPFVSIDKVEVNLENIDLKETSFKETENNFNFSLTGSWLKDPTNVIYAYQLIGLNNDWYITRDRAVRFPQLPHGKY
ncbi:MAG: hypothetical protein HKO66_16700, partial [Saprospiraceae bacterium]|nr:hypothetical protein [Saprospiraceae bacterium]